MYEQFTDRAQRVFQMANEEARRFRCDYIQPEHILLALIKLDSGDALTVLRNLEVDIPKLRKEIESQITEYPDKVQMGWLLRTPSANKVIENSVEESRKLKQNYFGTEHLLLGLLLDEGIAGQTLRNAGLELESTRKEVGRVPRQIESV